MNLKALRIVFMALLLIFLGSRCKTPEPARVYVPVFDQTSKTYVKTASNRVLLDTSVLIRSNVLENLFVALDTIVVEELFNLESGELAVPLELINEKPPLFDTFLVVNDFRYPAAYVDLLFPVIPVEIIEAFGADSALGLPEQTNAVPIQTTSNVKQVDKQAAAKVNSKKKPAIFLSKRERIVQRNRREIDKKLAQKQAGIQNTSQQSVPKAENVIKAADAEKNNQTTALSKPQIVAKELYSREEIMTDSTRDLLDAGMLLDRHLSEMAWQLGDSIPFYMAPGNYFLDSTLVVFFDTVYVEVIDSTRMVAQLPFNKLVKVKRERHRLAHQFFVNERLIFKVFHPEIDDVFIDMIRVQGGDFKWGNNEFDEDERPATMVTVSSFLMGKYEVTNKIFCYFLNDQLCDSAGQIEGIPVIDLQHPDTRIRRNHHTGRFSVSGGYDEYPVVNVTWIGAQMFCKYAGGRLPSEAEWEYAARGGIYARRFYLNAQKTDYDYVFRYAGGDSMHDLGWFVDNSRGQLWVGGRKMPNELSLFDMSGNAWEWCYDKYSKDFYKRNNRSRNPMCLDGGNLRVNRGGSWSSDAMYCRVSNRNFLDQYSQNPFLGFRLMREWK